jgi:hypothetical protein
VVQGLGLEFNNKKEIQKARTFIVLLHACQHPQESPMEREEGGAGGTDDDSYNTFYITK